MKEKLIALMAQKKQAVGEMRAAHEAADQAAFDAAQAKVSALDGEIAQVQAIMQAEQGLPALDDGGAAPAAQTPPQKASSREVMHAFCECVRAAHSRDRDRFDKGIAILQNAAGDPLRESVESDGGLLVPQDIMTMINERKRDFAPLSGLFNVETVSTNKGSRVVDTAPNKGFTKLTDENTDISKDDKPAFAKIEYAIDDYALIIPISNDLMEDNDAGLLAYLTGWFAKKQVITENKLLLELLTALDGAAATSAAGKELETLKKAVNVTLDPAISLNAAIITNQDGFQMLDNLADANKRNLLQPDPVDATIRRILGMTVHVVSNALLPTKTTAPLYVGDFKQFGTLFLRRGLTVDSTNVGGTAWTKNQTEVRAISRMCARTVDDKAATSLKLTVAAAPGG